MEIKGVKINKFSNMKADYLTKELKVYISNNVILIFKYKKKEKLMKDWNKLKEFNNIKCRGENLICKND